MGDHVLGLAGPDFRLVSCDAIHHLSLYLRMGWNLVSWGLQPWKRKTDENILDWHFISREN